MPNSERWRILHLEDNEFDRELVRHTLAREGISAELVYAATRDEFTQALRSGTFELILSDFTLPGYGGSDALAFARENFPDVPFIFISGTIGEERAIQCLKGGAIDYVLKDDPRRLAPAIRRALREAQESARRREAEAALRRSEQSHRLLFERNPQPMWMYDLETLRFLAVNDAAVAHYGWTREEFLAMTILDIRRPEDLPALRAQLGSPSTGFRAGDTWRHLKKDGTEIEVEIAAHELPFGERTARLVMINDVTERNRTARALERERALMRTLIDQIPDLIYVKDRESRFLLANKSLARLIGVREPNDLLGRTQADFPPAAQAAESRADEERVLAGTPLINREEPATDRDGQRRIYLTTKLPLRDPDGEITGLVGIGRDITARKTAEDARRRSEERFAAIFHSAPVGIGYSTPEGRMIDVNPCACEIFGYAREDVVGRTVQELRIWVRLQDHETVLARLRAEKTLRNFEAKFRRKSGEVRTGLFSIDMVQFGDGPVLLFMITDITERKVLEGELLRANRVQSVGRLASGIAHDINNILAPIMMSAPLLRMNLRPEEIEKTLATIETSANRGADLVRQLLMFGRGVEGERGPVRMTSLVNEVVKIAGETFPKRIVLRSRVAADTWAVRGDASQLHQVLLNLMVNARDAMPGDGTLTVEAKNVRLDENFTATHPEVQPGPFVRLTVSDTGTGIPAHIIDKIFDPFFTTKAVGQGTGLGLSTVLGIVKSHEGLVTVHSEENVGTTFEIYLPALSSGAEPASERTSAPPSGHDELVLVVDDEANIRTILQKALTAHHYRVLVANDGAEASAVFARHSSEIKLVITDLDMPYMNGMSLARTLQRMNPEVKILVSSGLGSARNAREWAAEVEALGIPPILPKPYSIDALLVAMHRLLSDDNTPQS